MFGTLISDLQQKKPLTFVENRDHASALNRNKRDKPHLSCHLCRARKIRCSGHPSGCDKCISLSTECLYEDRRKKRATSRSSGSLGASNKEKRSQTPKSGSEKSEGQSSKSDDALTRENNNGIARVEDPLSGWNGCEGFTKGSHFNNFSDWMDVDASFFPSPIPSGQNIPDMGSMIGNLPFPPSAPSVFDPDNTPSSVIQTSMDTNRLSASTKTSEIEVDDGRDWQSLLQSNNFSEPHADSQNTTEANGIRMILSGDSDTAGEESYVTQEADKIRKDSSAGCQCREITTSLFEELCAESNNSHQAGLDIQLRCFRSSLKHIATILDCNSCRPPAENNMLLAMAGHYMGTMTERIVTECIRLRRDFGDSKISIQGLDEMWFSSYQIEDRSELTQVLYTIVWIQLSRFSRLLEKLKVRMGVYNGPGVLLGETDKKVKAAKSMLLADNNPVHRIS